MSAGTSQLDQWSSNFSHPLLVGDCRVQLQTIIFSEAAFTKGRVGLEVQINIGLDLQRRLQLPTEVEAMTMASPHQPQPQYNTTHVSPKRKRGKDTLTEIQAPVSLQTTGLDATKVRKSSIDENHSPRTAVSDKLQRLGLQNSLSPTRVTRRISWSIDSIKPEAEITESPHELADKAMVMEEMLEPSISSAAASESSTDNAHQTTNQNLFRTKFQFNAGPSTDTTSNASVITSSSKRAKLAFADMPQSSTATPSPAKRCRVSTPPPSTPAPPLSPSPLAKKRPHSPNPESATSPRATDADMDTSEPDPNLSEFWWQPSEIIGHSPSDPEEDNRGINGIGYQKTKAEARNISEKKKKQIAEWRAREAKEARALRAGGRRSLGGVVSGRVMKSRSRSPAPSESGRRSPFSPKKEREEKVARAVRFEVR
ncbi:hypothetical protein H2198_006822 [Neophaeococcomyces mojaviensis]|uniref:Uncharacterized protein n=1 Tax=Neophaeococcomyces mojaviensis TaxID=3383035 RepID=A0ACC3A287_9EURO|nr:hypothetical protein H2198_006822 [Knufia sp. JES_112]